MNYARGLSLSIVCEHPMNESLLYEIALSRKQRTTCYEEMEFVPHNGVSFTV